MAVGQWNLAGEAGISAGKTYNQQVKLRAYIIHLKHHKPTMNRSPKPYVGFRPSSRRKQQQNMGRNELGFTLFFFDLGDTKVGEVWRNRS